MRLIYTCTFIFLIICYNSFGQNNYYVKIDKIKGSYTKTLKLPLNIRIITKYDQSLIFNLDSISNGYFYGNYGRDSMAINEIKTIHIRGIREWVKYPLIAACAVMTSGLALLIWHSFYYTLFVDGSYNELVGFRYATAAYAASFASIGIVLYHYPRTRFRIKKYSFIQVE